MKRDFVFLWLLLAIAFILFKFTSFSQISEIKERMLGNVDESLYSSTDIVPFNEIFSRISDLSSGNINEDTFPFPCDTTAKIILLIGDSMLEGIGPRLAAYAEENGHTLYTVIWYSSTTERWGKSDKMSKYIHDLKPDYIFLSLGGNELFVSDIKNKRDKYVKKILKDIGDIPFVWIGPPNWKPDTGINELIETNTKEGTFFLSNGMKFDRTKDGAHPTHASAALWVDSIVRWMPQHSRFPIKMNIPSKTSAKAKRIFMHMPDEE